MDGRGRNGTRTPDRRTSISRSLEGDLQEQPVRGCCGRAGCCQVGSSADHGPKDRLKLWFLPRATHKFHPGHSPFLNFQETQGWISWWSRFEPYTILLSLAAIPTLPSTSFTFSSLGLPSSSLVQQGADIIQLARKHRLEKTHTVNLTGN